MTLLRKTKEDVKEAHSTLGFRIFWYDIDKKSAAFEVHEVVERDRDDKPRFGYRGATTKIPDPELAYVHGFVHSDGSAWFNFGHLRFCGASDLESHLIILRYLVARATTLMRVPMVKTWRDYTALV